MTGHVIPGRSLVPAFLLQPINMNEYSGVSRICQTLGDGEGKYVLKVRVRRF
jgi:hypothetical protein